LDQLRIAEIREVDLVELEIAAAGIGILKNPVATE